MADAAAFTKTNPPLPVQVLHVGTHAHTNTPISRLVFKRLSLAYALSILRSNDLQTLKGSLKHALCDSVCVCVYVNAMASDVSRAHTGLKHTPLAHIKRQKNGRFVR